MNTARKNHFASVHGTNPFSRLSQNALDASFSCHFALDALLNTNYFRTMKVSVLSLTATVLVCAVANAQERSPSARLAGPLSVQSKDAIVVTRPAHDGAPAKLGLAEGVRTIPVELKTDKASYKEGEELVVTVHAAESGHLRLLYQNAAGEIYTLFPNQFITDDRIEGHHAVKVMPVANPKKPGDEVGIQITGPNFGTEFLAAVVSDQPFCDEAALREQLRRTAFARTTAPTFEAAITKSARVVPRQTRDGGSDTVGAGFARITLSTVRK